MHASAARYMPQDAYIYQGNPRRARISTIDQNTATLYIMALL